MKHTQWKQFCFVHLLVMINVEGSQWYKSSKEWRSTDFGCRSNTKQNSVANINQNTHSANFSLSLKSFILITRRGFSASMLPKASAYLSLNLSSVVRKSSYSLFSVSISSSAIVFTSNTVEDCRRTAKIECNNWEWFDRRELWLLVTEGCWDNRFCKETINQVMLARFHQIIHRFPSELSQAEHQVLIAVKELIRCYFGWNKALETPF